MEETGVVISTSGGEATVRFERTEACKKCGACKLGQDGEMLLEIDNSLEAQEGDRVSVALKETELFAASLLAYGLPLAGLILGLFIGRWIAPLFPTINADLVMTAGAAVFLALAFLINRLLEPYRKSKKKYQPVPIRLYDQQDMDS